MANTQRSRNAAKLALTAYANAMGDDESNTRDLVADLGHLWDAETEAGPRGEWEIRRGLDHYEYEVANPDAE